LVTNGLIIDPRHRIIVQDGGKMIGRMVEINHERWTPRHCRRPVIPIVVPNLSKFNPANIPATIPLRTRARLLVSHVTRGTWSDVLILHHALTRLV